MRHDKSVSFSHNFIRIFYHECCVLFSTVNFADLQFAEGTPYLEHGVPDDARKQDPAQSIDEVVVGDVDGRQRDEHDVERPKLLSQPGVVQENGHGQGHVEGRKSAKLQRGGRVEAVKEIDS